MKQKRFTRIRRFCKVVVLLSFSVLIGFTDRVGTFRPFQGLKSEEIKNVQVVNGNRVIHDMTDVEIEKLIDVLNNLTHNGVAHDFEVGFGGEVRFVLILYDGRMISVEGVVYFPNTCYVRIDMKPYYDVEGEGSRLLSDLGSAYFMKWCEEGMK